MPGPLTGMTVIEVSAFIAAPYAGLTLAQMGAEVIRIDPIGGGLDYNRWPVTDDGTSLYWAGLNKGKKSVTLNVRDPKGRELAHALMTAAGPGNGIVVTNLPARGWLDYEGLKAMRDDLIMVNIVGRRDGSVALDYTVNARAGFPLVTGPVGTEGPVNHVMPVWDVVTALAASNAVLVADRHRRDTGEGQYVRIALADSAFAVLSHLGYVAEAQINGTDRPATGNHVFGTFGCDFLTSDGRRVMITAFTPRHWSALVEATGLEERFAALAAEKGVDLAKEEERYALRETIEAELAPWFAARPLDEIGKALDAVGACWGPYQTFRQAVAEDPDLSAENPMFEEIDQPGIGRYLAAGSFIDFSGIPRDPVAPAPTLGNNTESVLSEKLGLTDSDLGALKDAKVI
ncbi:MAG: CoA transferase [Pseudomonadota bacterium]|nr:CoA transferase [Alphaproteobacteria bacterium]MEC7202045.1 CoA transferase [Pseudomonadota bacterium]MEC7301584.1 CoA transferase [Pseudomonadota bacterium]MEC7573314.1 CoA transferase [Pseudomonadota bacterium]MEC7647114.1 CoA transferase [Pseudomonadota bacterium]